MKQIPINITYQGLNGRYQAALTPDASDDTIRRICEEAVRGGEVPELPQAIPYDAFSNHVIDRFQGDQTRFIVRPQVPFG